MHPGQVEILRMLHERRAHGERAAVATPERVTALDAALADFQQICRAQGAAGAATYLLDAPQHAGALHSGTMIIGRTFDDVPHALTALLAALCGLWGDSGCELEEVIDRLTRMTGAAIRLALASKQAQNAIPPEAPRP